MSAAIHPAASHHLPGFITAPGETDVWMVVSLIMLVAIVVGIGVFYFKIHALPEQIAHKTDKVQFQVVAVLSLLALFPPNPQSWIAAMLLALVRLPDFSTPLVGMAASLSRMADAKGPQARAQTAAPAKTPASKQGKAAPAGKGKEAGNA